jgi:hypothetical protein
MITVSMASSAALLLGYYFTCVELNQHCPVCFHLLEGHSQSEVIQDKELELEVVQLG